VLLFSLSDLHYFAILKVDPPGCKDIDDALHCIELDNGNWQVGVHIADVTHYVEAGSAIDLEASNRSTSTYLVVRNVPYSGELHCLSLIKFFSSC
jgi:exosome complex exonuclease DIS3/RRP44